MILTKEDAEKLGCGHNGFIQPEKAALFSNNADGINNIAMMQEFGEDLLSTSYWIGPKEAMDILLDNLDTYIQDNQDYLNANVTEEEYYLMYVGQWTLSDGQVLVGVVSLETAIDESKIDIPDGVTMIFTNLNDNHVLDSFENFEEVDYDDMMKVLETVIDPEVLNDYRNDSMSI